MQTDAHNDQAKDNQMIRNADKKEDSPERKDEVRVLLVGNAAREHALAAAIKRSRHKPRLFSYMKANNPGIADLSDEICIGNYGDLDRTRDFARRVRPEFAVVGPEDPLEKGVVDELEKMGIGCFGPCRELAQLETSKGFARRMMSKYDILGNPEYRIFSKDDKSDDMLKFIRSLSGFVVKPDGLTGGKGVKVQGEHLADAQDALAYCQEVLETHPRVVVEEKLVGEEFSLQCITDGKTVIATPPVQDHKRAHEGDTGPNTGGMGTYTFGDHSLPFLSKKDIDEGLELTRQMAKALHKETGKLYKGVMYAGLIATRDGVRLIEYNARFGDPEAMNTLPCLESDLVDLCRAVISGSLDTCDVRFARKATVCKYAVPQGYPDNPVKDKKIDVSDVPEDALMFFASVDRKKDGLYMTGSRAIAFVGMADGIEDAERIAEAGVSSVKGPVFHRKDIGTMPLIQKRTNHMKKLRNGEISGR